MRVLLPSTLRSRPHPFWNYRCAQEICPLRITRIIPWYSLKLMAEDGNQPASHQSRPFAGMSDAIISAVARKTIPRRTWRERAVAELESRYDVKPGTIPERLCQGAWLLRAQQRTHAPHNARSVHRADRAID